MTKEQFLKQLEQKLTKLPAQEREDIIQDYKEYFENAALDDKAESETVQALGSPTKLAKELAATYFIDEVEKKTSAKNIFHAIWATVGLGFLNLIFILGPFIAVAATIFALWLAALAFVVAPIAVIANPIFTNNEFSPFDLFASLALAGLGIFLSIAMYYCTKYLIKWSIRYLKYNVKIVKGGNNND